MSGCSGSGFLPAVDARLKARNDRVIYAEICAIEQQILDTINNCTGTAPLEITINGGTPITTPNGIESIMVLDGGSQYIESSPTVAITSTAGTGFAAIPLVDLTTGAVIGFNISDRGSDYEVGDVVDVTHALGATGILFEGVVSAVSDVAPFDVLGITITVGGTGYLDTPYVTILDPESTGSGFIGTIELDPADNSVVEISILNGGRNYSTNSTAIIVGDVGVGGSNAIITTTTQSSMYNVNVDPSHYYEVWAGLVDDKAVKLQIDTIQQYFISLGYNFIIQVNPVTMDTLQWYISW